MTNEILDQVKFAKIFIDEFGKIHLALKDKTNKVLMVKEFESETFKKEFFSLLELVDE